MKNLKRNFAVLSLSILAMFVILQNSSFVSAKVNPMQTQSFGKLEGSLTYPGESIPKNMNVCAQNIETNIRYCNHRHLKNKKYIHGLGFKITVPVGKYNVYALYPIFDEQGKKTDNYAKAYESEFTACGQTSDCLNKSHDPLIFEVKKGKTISGIDHLEETADLKKAMEQTSK